MFGNLAALINSIALAVANRFRATFSQQMSQQQSGGASPSLMARLAAVFGIGRQTWSGQVGTPSLWNQYRLKESGKVVKKATDEHSAAYRQYAKAATEYEDEKKNPTGKNLVLLQTEMILYQQALKDASDKLKAVTRSHDALKVEVDRQTKWETERNRANRFGPRRFFKRLAQRARIAGKRWQRAKQSLDTLARARTRHSKATRAHTQNVASEQSAKRRYDTAKNAYLDAKASGMPAAEVAKRRAAATAAARDYSRARHASSASYSTQRQTGSAVTTATTVAGGALSVMGKGVVRVIGVVIGALTTAFLAVGAFVNRQVAKSDALIRGTINERSQMNATVAGAMARYERANIGLNIKTGAQTAASSAAVIDSQIKLKEAKQPMDARWENIGNRWQNLMNIAATNLQKVRESFDFITPLVEVGIKYLEKIAKVHIDPNVKPLNPGIEAMKQAAIAVNKPAGMRKPIPGIK